MFMTLKLFLGILACAVFVVKRRDIQTVDKILLGNYWFPVTIDYLEDYPDEIVSLLEESDTDCLLDCESDFLRLVCTCTLIVAALITYFHFKMFNQ